MKEGEEEMMGGESRGGDEKDVQKDSFHRHPPLPPLSLSCLQPDSSLIELSVLPLPQSHLLHLNEWLSTVGLVQQENKDKR